MQTEPVDVVRSKVETVSARIVYLLDMHLLMFKPNNGGASNFMPVTRRLDVGAF